MFNSSPEDYTVAKIARMRLTHSVLVDAQNLLKQRAINCQPVLRSMRSERKRLRESVKYYVKTMREKSL